MTSSPGSGRPGSAAGTAQVLIDVRRAALEAADALLQHVPDTGDHTTGRAVDAFVEQSVDALRALAEVTGEALATGDDGDGSAERGPDPGPVGARLPSVELPPRGWHW